MTILPRELVNADNVGFSAQDLAKLRKNPSKTVAVSQLHVGRYVASLLLKGELTTEGIVFTQHEEYGDKYSFGIRLEEEADVQALNDLVQYLDDAIGADEEDVEWTDVLPIKDENGVLYLKCKTNSGQTAFAFTSNLKLHPKKPNSEIFRYMPVEVEVLVGAYFNVRENNRGIYFTIRHVEFKKPTTETREMATQTESAPSSPAERVPKRMAGMAPNTRSTTRGKRMD